jgi:hypothetical protein
MMDLRKSIKIWHCPKVTGMRYRLKEQGNVSALVQIFNAIPSPSFSAPAELRMINPNLWTLSSVNPTLKPMESSCSIHPRRPTRSDSLEGRFRKAKSSMPLRHFPAPLFRFYFPSLWDNLNFSLNRYKFSSGKRMCEIANNASFDKLKEFWKGGKSKI